MAGGATRRRARDVSRRQRLAAARRRWSAFPGWPTCAPARALADGVPGDLIETGVWRGGTPSACGAFLKALRRTCAIARCGSSDSFRGLSAADAERYPLDDAAARWHTRADELAVSVKEVKENFRRSLRAARRPGPVPRGLVPRHAAHRARPRMGAHRPRRRHVNAHDRRAQQPLPGPRARWLRESSTTTAASRRAARRSPTTASAVASPRPIHEVDWTAVWWRKPQPPD